VVTLLRVLEAEIHRAWQNRGLTRAELKIAMLATHKPKAVFDRLPYSFLN
jgi:hypothetical protein